MEIAYKFACNDIVSADMPDAQAKMLGYTKGTVIKKALKCPNCFKRGMDTSVEKFEQSHTNLPEIIGRTESEINYARSARAQILAGLKGIDSKAAKAAFNMFAKEIDPQFWIDALARKATILDNARK